MLEIPDVPHLANSILAEGLDQPVEVVALAVAPDMWFVPDRALRVACRALEVEAKAVAVIRGHLVKQLPQEQIDRE